MNRRTRIISYIIASLMILGSLQVIPSSEVTGPVQTENADLARVDIVSLLPDSDFNELPEVVINGSSSEFSSQFTDVTGHLDSYVELRWTHTANTSLDYVGQDPDYILPDYNDFVYVYQEFDWSYDMRPEHIEASFNYSTFLSGDFEEGAQDGNNLMFRVYVWAIDSSDNWIRLYESRDATYTEEYQMKTISLNYFMMTDIFDGMIEQDGVQEDPEDKVKIAIGLAPTHRFESYSGTEPWTFYNGTVSVKVTSCEFYAYIETEDDPSQIWQPEYNVTYGTTFGDVFPTHPNASDDVHDWCFGMVTGDDGSVYVSGNSYSSYELYESEGLRFRNQFLLKYSQSLDLLWAVQNSNETQVRSMTFQDGFIYTTGYRYTVEDNQNLIVTKWSTTGAKIWESEWGEEYSQVGVGVAVQENGSVYVIASDYDLTSFPGYMNTSILKFDTDGTLVWEQNQSWIWLIYDNRGDLYIQGEYLYFSYFTGISVLDLEGNYVAELPGSAMIPDGNNGCFLAYRNDIQGIEDSSFVAVFHCNATGYPIWNVTYIKQWSSGRYHYYIPVGMSVTPDDTLLILLYSFSLNFEFVLLSYDFEGNLLNNRTISTDCWPWMGGGPIFMDVGKNGLGYFAFDILEGVTDINVQAFLLYEAPAGISLTIPMVVAIGSTIVIIVAIVSILRVKKRE